jgi:hypothetical protein
MRSVRSAIASMLPRYCTKTSPAPPLGADKRDTRGSLTIRSTASATSRRIWFASGLSSSPAPPRSLQRLSRKPSVPVRRAGLPRSPPGHHPARLGLGAPQDATGAERCAVSVGPVDRMFATPPDSPGQCEPGLSDDRPRDPRFCYCPELSPRATRSSSS